MKRSAVLLVIFLSASSLALADASLEKRRSPVVEVVEEVGPSVVNISTEKLVENPFFSRNPSWDMFFRFFSESPLEKKFVPNSLGSGTIIDPEGLILTNEHVILGASRIKITSLGGSEYNAEVIGSDPSQDLALLKIEGEGPFPFTPMTPSSKLLIGETVIAIGNPFGLTNTVTTGVVSALKRSVRTGDKVYSDFIQTDASINPGNSGGPLLDINGKLIGINTAIIGEAEGIGFAIPIGRAKKIVEDLRTYGEIHSAWIGIWVETLSDEERQYIKGFPHEKKGALISGLYKGSPADAEGIEGGDILLKVDDEEISSRTDFRTVMSRHSPGDSISLTLLRSGKAVTKRVTAREIPDELVEILIRDFMGIEISNISSVLRRRYRYLPEEGAVVVGVVRGSEADRIGIEPFYDVFIKIQNREIRDATDMKKAIKAFWDRDTILCLIRRGRNLYRVPFSLR